MRELEQWNQQTAVFRNFPGKGVDRSLSCGFLNKTGKTMDVVDEHYERLAMVYVLKGRGEYSDSTGLLCPLKTGDVFFRCPDRTHSSSVEPGSPWLECFLSVRAEWYALLSSLDLMPPGRIRIAVGERPEIPEAIDGYIRRLSADDTPRTNSDTEFEMVALIRNLLIQQETNHSGRATHGRLVEQARARIRQLATNPQSLETILANSGISYSRLRSLFRQAYGISPGDYRIQVRIEQACALLRSTDLSVKEIAARLGYADAFAFSKQFKQRTGTSPKAFRNHRTP